MTAYALRRLGTAVEVMVKPMEVSHCDEVQMVAAAKTSASAFAALYEIHYQAIANYLFRRTMDAHVTEDLLSEVFLSALREMPRYHPRGTPFRAWLYRIANNALRKWFRTKQRELRRLRIIAERSAGGNSTTAEPPRDCQVLGRYVQELSVRHQEVIALYYFENQNVAQIAQVLGVREGTVKSRLGRARDLLRSKFVDCHE